MKYNITLLLLLLLSVSSCVSSYKISILQVELMKSSAIANTVKIYTIALFSRDMNGMDTTAFEYFYCSQAITDSAIHYMDNYNTCLDALAETLVSEGSFLKVINCRDSLNQYIKTTDTTLYAELYHRLGADALVFLDRYKLNDFQYKRGDKGTGEIIDDFNEFAKSTYLANIWGSLQWTARIKGDTTRYETLQMDDLYYGDTVYPDFFGSNNNHKRMLDNTSIYFGKQFAEKLIPSWQQQERTYYISRDSVMQKGAHYCIKGEWLKAAETYKHLTISENSILASRAAYNMALVCEMSGEPDAAIDWLMRSESSSPPNDSIHKERCKQYVQILQERKKEIKLLDDLMSKKAAILPLE